MNKRTKFTTTFDKELLKRLKIEAVKRETTAIAIIEKAVTEYLDKTDSEAHD